MDVDAVPGDMAGAVSMDPVGEGGGCVLVTSGRCLLSAEGRRLDAEIQNPTPSL